MVWSARAEEGAAMGEHSKPEPDLSQGKPPPNNADGQVEPQPAPDGQHKKDE